MYFLGFGDPVPDGNTIWTFRKALTKAGATLSCRHRVGAQAAQHPGREAGAQGSADTRRLATAAAKLRQKDRNARWTVKTTAAKPPHCAFCHVRASTRHSFCSRLRRPSGISGQQFPKFNLRPDRQAIRGP